jgi:hypothetical protein
MAPPQLAEAGAHACLDRSERLVQTLRDLCIGQVAEKCDLDRFPLGLVQHQQGVLQRAAAVRGAYGVVRVFAGACVIRSIGIRVHALFAILEAETIDCPRARLIHDPADDGAVGGIV